jgi:hypothetical protein
VVFRDQKLGLGQLLLDVSESDFDELGSMPARETRRLALYLIDRVKVAPF